MSRPFADSLENIVVKVLELQYQSFQPSGLIYFRIVWFALLAVQETLKHLLQHHSSKASILWLSAFFMVQLSHLYMTAANYSFNYMDLCQPCDVSAF